VKIAPRDADSFAASPPAAVRAVLVYGPDDGLVRERAMRLVTAVAETPADPFRVAEIPAARLNEQPALLRDEAAALSLTGGRRAVRVREASDRFGAEALADFLKSPPPGDTLVVVEAGDLPPRSVLRHLFEGAREGAALPCYADDARALRRLAQAVLGERRIRISEEALDFIADHLGSDREVSRRELEKLALYAGDGGTIALDDAIACVGDSAGLTLEDVAFAAAAGDSAALDRGLTKAFGEGLAAVAVLRAALRHFQRLYQTAARVRAGESEVAAMKALRPAVFFKYEDRFRAALRRWREEELVRALRHLTHAEIRCKTTGFPEETVCLEALMALAAKSFAAAEGAV
jgi:DNA polymerase-3 subunit delta